MGGYPRHIISSRRKTRLFPIKNSKLNMPHQHNRPNKDKAVERAARLASELSRLTLQAPRLIIIFVGRPSGRFVRRNLVAVVLAPRPGSVVASGEFILRPR